MATVYGLWMQPQDGGRGDLRGKNLNFEKRLTWTIGRSDGKLVLARWRRVDFWFRVADRSNRRACESSYEMVLGGISPTRVVNLFQREIWILTASPGLTAKHLNFEWRIPFLLANFVIFDENFRFEFFRGEGAFEFLLLTCRVITVWDLTFFLQTNLLSNFNGCDIWCCLSRYRNLFMKTQVKGLKCSSLLGNADFCYKFIRVFILTHSIGHCNCLNLTYNFVTVWHFGFWLGITSFLINTLIH